jgi:pimeloyl-ACP methyl ester carboxylesterase
VIEQLQIRVHGEKSLPTLIYLPGLHGDWTLVTSFRAAMTGRARFVEMTYPRSLDWSIADYAQAIQEGLLSNNIHHGWLLGESFGSQIAWAISDNSNQSAGDKDRFRTDGVILAGGFVKHPWKWGPGLLCRIGSKMAPLTRKLTLKIYARYAKFRHRNAPEVLETIKEFVDRRTELDRQAMLHRLSLLDQYDPRPAARNIAVPVHYLAGSVDPLVPWMLVRRWLRKNCPTYRAGKTIWRADHNVLSTAPAASANIIWQWMNSAKV